MRVPNAYIGLFPDNEDYHLTLAFLGNIQTKIMVDECIATIAYLAERYIKLEVMVCGKGEIGPNHVPMVLVNSIMLDALREDMMESNVVRHLYHNNTIGIPWISHISTSLPYKYGDRLPLTRICLRGGKQIHAEFNLGEENDYA